MNPLEAQFENLVLRHLDGHLAPDEETRLRERLHNDAAARRRFVELTDLHAMLAGDASLAGEVLAERDRVSAKIIAHPNWHRWRVPVAAAAAAVALLAGAMFWFSRPRTGDRGVANGENLDGVFASAKLAVNDWRMPSDQLLDEEANEPSPRIAGLVGDINSLLQP